MADSDYIYRGGDLAKTDFPKTFDWTDQWAASEMAQSTKYGSNIGMT
jgi:hypothetical protein